MNYFSFLYLKIYLQWFPIAIKVKFISLLWPAKSCIICPFLLLLISCCSPFCLCFSHTSFCFLNTPNLFPRQGLCTCTYTWFGYLSPNQGFSSQHYWHFGLVHFWLVGLTCVHYKIFSSIPSIDLIDASSHSSCVDNQNCLYIWPNVPMGEGQSHPSWEALA